MTTPSDFSQVANVIGTLAEAGTRTRRGTGPIPEIKPAGAPIGESIGTGRAGSDPQGAGRGSGIASPLKEPDVGRRVYYPDQLTYGVDGGMYMVNHIKKLYLVDSLGNEFVYDGFGLPDPNNINIEA